MQITPELIEKYHLGLCTSEEAAFIAAWLNDDLSLEDFDQDIADPQEKAQADHNMRQFLSDKTGIEITDKRSVSISPLFLRIAAALFLCTLLSVLYFNYYKADIPESLVAAQSAYKEIKTNYGEKFQITLPDGTLVHLNSGSKLSYPEKFSDSTRQVILTGEAFFSVKKDPAHPFIINGTHNTKIRVLGTAFNVRAYSSEKQVKVSVEEGSVHFTNTDGNVDPVILAKGESASYYALDHTLKRTEHNEIVADLGWKNNQLIFTKEKLSDVAVKIERWYGVKVNITEDQLASLRYSGSYNNPDLIELMKNMSFVMGFKYKISTDNKVITLY